MLLKYILYDSVSENPALKPGWAFSGLVKTGNQTVLLDTGWQSELMQHNLHESGWKATGIQHVVISHWHPDHYGGLDELLQQNPKLQAYVPVDYPGPPHPQIQIIRQDQYPLSDTLHILSTFPNNQRFGVKEELTLAVKTAQGPLLVSGCFHTGWPGLIQAAKKLDPEPPYLMVGGGRFIDRSPKQLHTLAKQLQTLGLKNVGLSHCASGPLSTQIFNKYFPAHTFNYRLGATISFP